MKYLLLKRDVSGTWKILGFYLSKEKMCSSHRSLLEVYAEGDLLCYERTDPTEESEE